MELALLIATWSKDPSTRVGAVVVGPDKEIRGTGYNGFPRGIDDDIAARWERPIKYNFIEHAERNCIYNASLYGVSLRGCSLYISYPPCTECARAIIQSGIKEVFYMNPMAGANIPGWRDSVRLSFDMFDEAGIKHAELGID